MYLKQLLLHPVNTSAVIPSSKELARTMIRKASLHNASSIVELGPGNGVFTKLIIQKIPEDTKLLAFEINKEFAELTMKNCNIPVYNVDALNFHKYLGKHDIINVDRIISGLPFSVFDAKTQDKLIQRICDKLSPDGRFITFSYLHTKIFPGNLRFKQLLDKYFSKVEVTKTVWKNFPPAYVYCAYK